MRWHAGWARGRNRFIGDLWQPYALVRLCAIGLALLAVIVAIHQARRLEHTSPTIAMFLLALFIIVGRS